MPSPVYSAGTPGNLLSGVSLATTKNAAAFLDLSTCIEGQVTCELITATQPTAATTFSAFKAYAAGASAPITLTATAAAGATSLSVSGATGLYQGQTIALVTTATKVGELVTITSISGTTLTVPAIAAAAGTYAIGASVYLMAQTASFVASPAIPSTGLWAANSDYSAELFLGPAQWIVSASNTATQTVTVNATVDKITAIQ